MCAEKRDNGNVWAVEARGEQNLAANYEEAVAATGYGLFNILLLLAALPIAWACIIDTTSTAFIINSTECIFELTMLRRGIAFSTIFIGMIIAGPIWDFILKDCVTGYLGKRNVMIIGILLDAVCNILWIHATSYYVFILLKFISGMLIAGPLSVLMTYLTEFHAPTYQQKFTKWAGLLIGISYIIPAALAATLFLRTPWFHFTIYNYFYPTWRVYLLICAMPSVLGLLLLCLLPKSPKFLMAQGKNQDALRLFRAMYRLNNFRPLSDYPIKKLNSSLEVKKIKINFKDKIRKETTNLKMLFSKSHSNIISVTLILQFVSMLGFNVMRLWVPPIFVMLNNFRVLIRPYYPTNEYITMCEMLFPRIQKIDHSTCNYTLPSVESAVYINSTIIATSAVSFGFLFALIFTTKIRRIIVIAFLLLLSSIGAFGANWVVEIPYMLVFLGFVIVASRIAGNTLIAHATPVIPQILKPTALSIINLIGNVGAVIGNIIFCLMLEVNCLSAFCILGFLSTVGTIIAPIFLSKQSIKAIEPEIEKHQNKY